MDLDILLGTAGVVVALIPLLRSYQQRRRHRIRPINLNRQNFSQFKYFQRMKSSDPEQFFKYTRMSVPQFDNLLEMVTPVIRRRKISLGITPEERLAITLQYVIMWLKNISFENITWFQIFVSRRFDAAFGLGVPPWIDNCLKNN